MLYGRKVFNKCFAKMPGLSETERAGLKQILGSMTAGDLMSLSDTVTNKMIVVENITGKRQPPVLLTQRISHYSTCHFTYSSL